MIRGEVPYNDELEVVFLHVPKTGGTAIKRLFDIHQLDSHDPSEVPSPQHLTCELLLLRMGAEKYDRYYRFTFVRNPWARMLSAFLWRRGRTGDRPPPSFPEFVREARRVVEEESYYEHAFGDHFIPQVRYAEDVHDVFRYEAFEAGVRAVADRLGVSIGAIPQREGEPRHYPDYYDDRSRAVVAEVYRDEIERFGYVYGE